MDWVWSIDAVYDTGAMSQYGNITSISESPLQEGLIYVGTDDGLIQVTEDGGLTWRKVERIYGVPEEVFVNGKQCVAMRVYPGRADSVGVSLRSQGQDAALNLLDAWQMKNIYK